MIIYTSYFDNLQNIPKEIIPIAICGKSPDWYDGFEYKKLAPKLKFFQEWKKNRDNQYYINCFREQVLEQLNAENVYKELATLANADACVLVCYEQPDEFCHRHLVATWLNENIDMEYIEEWR